MYDGYQYSKKKKPFKILFILLFSVRGPYKEFKNFKEIEFRLQVKFYTLQKMKHATWGEKLNSISMDCTAGRGTYQSYVEKMKYI